jgi:capsular exopolysaccharide synthesis family protein
VSSPTAVGPEPASPGSELDFRYYAGVLWRARVFVVAFALLGFGLGYVVALIQTPEYRAAATIQIEPPTPTFMTVNDALVGAGNYWQNVDFYNTEFRVMKSKTLGDNVVERLKLKDRPPFKGAPEPGQLFMSHVAVEPVPESRLVMLSVIHTSPQEAALWANTLAESYIEQTTATRVETAKRAYDWLQERLAATQQQMREAQDKLFKNIQSQDLFVPEGSVSAVTSSITKLNEDFIDAQARRIVIEAALKQASEMRASGAGLDALPQVAADAAVAGFNTQIAALNVDLTRLAEKFKEGHPEVQKAQAQLGQLRKAKEARAVQVLEGLRAEHSQLQKRETELRVAIDGQKAAAAQQSKSVAELDALKKEAESAKSLYEVLLQKLRETDIAASVKSNKASVMEKATVPQFPVRPVKRKIAGAGMFLGLVLGVGLVLLRDFLANTIKDPEEVERYLHLDLLAAVPRYDEANVHLVTEAYQNLRTALIFARPEEHGQVILVTGTAPQEGKTTTLVNLAKLLAASGEKTIVIDCDLRRAQIHHRLDVSREPGLTDYFVRHEDLDTLIQPTHVPNLYALTSGPLPPNPPAMLARKNMGQLLGHLKRHFDWILIDSPPLASVTDAVLLARLADLAVMVVQHNKVDKKLVKRSVTALRKATPNLLGVVLNAVNFKGQPYHQYYGYYTQTEEADAPGGAAQAAPETASRH